MRANIAYQDFLAAIPHSAEIRSHICPDMNAPMANEWPGSHSTF
jgi:hypothetical protein